MTCEDFPCCGHEAGCCPDFDESGRQLNMVCVCGKKLPVTNGSSICDSCLNGDEFGDDYEGRYGGFEDDFCDLDHYEDDFLESDYDDRFEY